MDSKVSDLREQLRETFSTAASSLKAAQSPGDVETQMAAFLHLAKANPDQRSFVFGLLTQSLVEPECPWEFIQFVVHGLRWEEIKRFVREARQREVDDLRARAIWDHLLSAFDDNWEDAEFYREYASR